MQYFKIVCKQCGYDNCEIWNWHNEYEEGQRIKCPKCGTKENL